MLVQYRAHRRSSSDVAEFFDAAKRACPRQTDEAVCTSSRRPACRRSGAVFQRRSAWKSASSWTESPAARAAVAHVADAEPFGGEHRGRARRRRCGAGNWIGGQPRLTGQKSVADPPRGLTGPSGWDGPVSGGEKPVSRGTGREGGSRDADELSEAGVGCGTGPEGPDGRSDAAIRRGMLRRYGVAVLAVLSLAVFADDDAVASALLGLAEVAVRVVGAADDGTRSRSRPTRGAYAAACRRSEPSALTVKPAW